MAKAAVNDSADNLDSAVDSSTEVSRTPVRINSSGTPLWYKIIMFGLMIIGVLWLVTFYLAGSYIPFMKSLDAWNYVIGFGALFIGLLMTMGWK